MRLAVAATVAVRGPKACLTRPTSPPGIRNAQLSISIARTNAASTTTPTANPAAEEPGNGTVVPPRKKIAIPSCVMASAAALRTDMNDSSAVEERTTRIGRRGGVGVAEGIVVRLIHGRSAGSSG